MRREACQVLVILIGLLPVACSDDTQTSAPDAKVTVPDATIVAEATIGKDGASAASASFSELKPYDAVKGTASIKADAASGTSKLELLADGKPIASLTTSPWTFNWDTLPTADGIVKLSLKATNGTGTSTTSKELPVVILNNGSEATWTDGNSGKVTVPASGYVEQHLKFHWTMPDGIKKIVVVLFWEVAGFKLELATGVGNCPDSGTLAKKQESDTAPLGFEYASSSGSLGTGQWFAHVALMNPTEVLGKETPFSVKAYLLK